MRDGDVPPAEHVRCPCGNLLARLTPRGIEVKCRRCKRVVAVVPDPTRAGRLRSETGQRS